MRLYNSSTSDRLLVRLYEKPSLVKLELTIQPNGDIARNWHAINQLILVGVISAAKPKNKVCMNTAKVSWY